jgi:hypothetical protein
MRPDPANIEGELYHWENPQSWNAYSYVQNNPMNAIDPDGLDCIYVQGLPYGIVVEVATGECDPGIRAGIYVNGAVDVKSLKYADGELTYSYTNQKEGTSGVGVIALDAPPGPDELSQFAKDVFSQPSLQIAAATMNDPRTYALWLGLSATAGYGLYAAGVFQGGLTTFGGQVAAGEIVSTSGEIASISRLGAQAGRKAVERALRSYEKRLAEHVAKVRELKGDPKSVQREIDNFRGLIKAAKEWLSKN